MRSGPLYVMAGVRSLLSVKLLCPQPSSLTSHPNSDTPKVVQTLSWFQIGEKLEVCFAGFYRTLPRIIFNLSLYIVGLKIPPGPRSFGRNLNEIRASGFTWRARG